MMTKMVEASWWCYEEDAGGNMMKWMLSVVHLVGTRLGSITVWTVWTEDRGQRPVTCCRFNRLEERNSLLSERIGGVQNWLEEANLRGEHHVAG
jgi:hypothetical protein